MADFLLTYIETRGRAEPINLMLIDANVSFYDERIPIEEWQSRKKEGKYGPVYGQPFHGLPTLEVQTLMGPFKLAGTYAILDYLDDAFYTHEGRDMLQKGKVNMIRDVSMSFLLDFQELLKSETWDDPEEHAAVHKSRVLPFLLDLSRHISMNGLRKLFGADPATPLTAAGACAFEALDLIDLIFPSTLAEWPILASLRQRIASRPNIEAYLESGRRQKQITMSPHETSERIAVARTHPLVFERKRPETPVLEQTAEDAHVIVGSEELLPFARKKKGRRLPSRPSTVAGDGKGKAFDKGASWVESKAFEPGTNHRRVGSVTDGATDESVPATDGGFSDPGYRRTRHRTISAFFRKKEPKARPLPQETKDRKETKAKGNGPRMGYPSEGDEMRGSGEITLDITRARTTPREDVRVRVPRGKGKRYSHSESEYSEESDGYDEIKPRAL